jgi:predicted PurR-regulated permease PerM
MPRHVEEPGPTEMRDPFVRQELKRACIWIGLVIVALLVWQLSHALLVIFGGLVLASMLDGGTRLLGRIVDMPRVWRLLIVSLGVVAFLTWVLVFTGTQLVEQFDGLRLIIQNQILRIAAWAQEQGLGGSVDVGALAKEAGSYVGKVTSAVSSVFGMLTAAALMIVIGVFLAIEPRNYERGMAWMFPLDRREQFYETMNLMGHTMRRLMAGRILGMTIEGFGTWLLLWIGGVPMAGLLGLLTGIFAFLPNIGAIISGSIMVLVGFSAGTNAGLWAIAVYFVVHLIDGWMIAPLVAKRSVDLAPALVLSAQLFCGALFGVMGLIFADPIIAMIKVALEKGSEESAERAEEAEAAAKKKAGALKLRPRLGRPSSP